KINDMKKIINLLQRYKESGIVLADQAIVSGGNFLLGILLARFLGLDQYGVYALLWMVILFGLSLNQAFITKPLLSLGPKIEKADQPGYLSVLHGIQLLYALLAGCLAFGVLLLGGVLDIPVPESSVLISLPFIMVMHLSFDFYRKACFVKGDLPFALVLDGGVFFIQFGGLLLLWQMNKLSVANALWVVLVANSFAVLTSIWRFGLPNFHLTEVKKVVFQHFRFAKWLIGTSVLQWFSGNFFIIAAGGILGTTAVGAVRIVQNVMGLTHVLFLAMENVVPVKAALHFKEGGHRQLFWYLRNMTLKMGLPVGLMLTGMALFAPLILSILYGKEYAGYSFVVVGFCIAYILVYLGHPLRFALRTLEQTKPIFIAYVCGTLFSMAAAYPLIRQWEMWGLIAGIFITQLLSLMVYCFFLWKPKKYHGNHSLSTR
ncbi:MAG: lipopolysaccharide biosynthesis protein, partial [Bacteroidota bacterium]